MVHERIIFLGPTGVSKATALEKIRTAAHEQLGRNLKIIDFEKDLMVKTKLFNNWPGFLRGDISFQVSVWHQAWELLKERLGSENGVETPTILSMHAAYVRGDEGVRSVMDLARICSDFKPTLIVTLIDDVYSMWWRTEDRAEGESHRGRPTLEQLIIARRSEVTLGDLISCQSILTETPRHIILSVHHPVDVFLELIYFDAEICYLSFPISAPRDLLKDNNDPSFCEAINQFHQKVLREFRSRIRPKPVFISPLAIDELPLSDAINDAVKTTNDAEAEEAEVTFDPAVKRWQVSQLWGEDEPTVSDIPPPCLPIPLRQAKDVTGLIRTDVGWRDYKLVRQARSLGVFCPKAPNREKLSRGVEAEILAAIQSGGDKGIYIWQNPDWDPLGLVFNLAGNPGSMDEDAIQTATTLVEDVDELVRRMLS